MKVALICTEKLPVPPIAGGAIQIYIDGILPYMSKWYEITVFCLAHPKLPDEEIKDNVKYIRVHARNAAEYLNNVKERISDKYDLIHIFNRPRWVSAIAEKVQNTKISLSLHNEMFLPEKITEEKAVECIKRVEFINTVSQFIADGVKKRYPIAEGKLNVVYSGVNANRYYPVWTKRGVGNKLKLKAKHGIEDCKVVLFVGRLSVKKGIHILMQAVEKVMDANPKVALVIVGSKWFGNNKQDEYTAFLKNIAERMKGPIIFTGFVSPKRIPAYYDIGDVFVCPSQWEEPLARVHYEAMAAGLPMITTNRGGNAEIVSDFENGIVIDNYDNPDTFAEHIEYLLENPSEALKIGKAGRKLVKKQFSWERVANDIKRAIDTAMGLYAESEGN